MTEPDHKHEPDGAGCVAFLFLTFMLAFVLFNWFGVRDGIRDGVWHDAVCSAAVCETPTPEAAP